MDHFRSSNDSASAIYMRPPNLLLQSKRPSSSGTPSISASMAQSAASAVANLKLLPRQSPGPKSQRSPPNALNKNSKQNNNNSSPGAAAAGGSSSRGGGSSHLNGGGGGSSGGSGSGRKGAQIALFSNNGGGMGPKAGSRSGSPNSSRYVQCGKK